jgi:hypothetical protein
MWKRFFLSIGFARTHLSFTTETDDPFTGTWREVRKGTSAKMGQLAIIPSSDGLSFQHAFLKPTVISYGKEFVDDLMFADRAPGSPPIMVAVFRIDDHTLELSYKEYGELILKNTYAVSSDGKHLKESGEFKGRTNKSAMEYDRIGPVPEGDAFFGIWQSDKLAYVTTIKFDGETIDWSVGDIHVVKAKLDGKKHKRIYSRKKTTTYQFKRLDDHTIKVVIKSERSNSREVWQVHGNMLTRTSRTSILSWLSDLDSGNRRTHVSEYERVK